MTSRLEQEKREAEARDRGDGVGKVILEWIPMGIIMIVVMGLLMIGMLALEPGPMELF
ncbi:hypothetical protein ACEE23_03920 [Corynebacterium sp. 32222D000AT]|uniref:hypothetical protein n=1 Tax=unclassified Corynebacterium TaxID=2624378 RepID=UPI002AA0A79A|nr:hypothetical protein [Mycobacteriaceae bacterium]MDY5829313.1 hypothetical protein [Corynebacterium sp.]